MFSCFYSCRLCDFFQEWKGCRGKKCLEVFNRAVVVFQCSADIFFCILIIIIAFIASMTCSITFDSSIVSIPGRYFI